MVWVAFREFVSTILRVFLRDPYNNALMGFVLPGSFPFYQRKD